MSHSIFIRLPRLLLVLAVLFCLPLAPAHAQTPGPNGFYYPVATIRTVATFLETGCDGYIADHYHLGWDLGQSQGQPIYAITGGTILDIEPKPGKTDPTGGDITFIWIQHSAIDPKTGATFNFWAVYGHTSIAARLGPGSQVKPGQVIGYTISYYNGDHCHFGINRSGIVTTVSYPTITYFTSGGQTTTAGIQAGWGRGTLPGGWCDQEGKNKPLLQANSGAIENFTDPQTFLTSYRAVGSGGSDTDIYVSGGSGSGDGSANNPYNTVKAAVDRANATQPVTIHIKPGTYGEKVSTSKHILFVTWGSGTVKIGG